MRKGVEEDGVNTGRGDLEEYTEKVRKEMKEKEVGGG